MDLKITYYCNNNRTKELQNYLNTSVKGIDILYDNGSYFRAAIFNDNPEMLNILLDYAENKQQVSRDVIQQILFNVKDGLEISPKIQEILYEYSIKDITNEDEDIEPLIDSKNIYPKEDNEIGEQLTFSKLRHHEIYQTAAALKEAQKKQDLNLLNEIITKSNVFYDNEMLKDMVVPMALKDGIDISESLKAVLSVKKYLKLTKQNVSSDIIGEIIESNHISQTEQDELESNYASWVIDNNFLEAQDLLGDHLNIQE